jgi:hypothetical protein
LPNTSVSLLRLCGTGSKWNSIGGCCPDIAGNYRGGQLPFSFLDAESAHPHGCRMARRRSVCVGVPEFESAMRQVAGALAYRNSTENWFVYSVPECVRCGELLTGITPQIGPNFYPLIVAPSLHHPHCSGGSQVGVL